MEDNDVGPNGSKNTCLGNTKEKRASSAKHWMFTRNCSDDEDWEDVIKTILKIVNGAKVDKYLFQEERGEETGRLHLQGYIKWFQKGRFDEFTWDKKYSWRKCGNVKAVKEYVNKFDTRVGRYWGNVQVVKRIDMELRPWQQELWESLKVSPDDRTVTWIYDEEGNSGKTKFCKWYLSNYGNGLYLSGKAADMKYGVSKHISDGFQLYVVFIDLTRSVEGFVSYQGIEEIKNGILFSTKYESNMCIFDSPHVVVFANFMPCTEKLSRDRWDIKEVRGKEFVKKKKWKEVCLEGSPFSLYEAADAAG